MLCLPQIKANTIESNNESNQHKIECARGPQDTCFLLLLFCNAFQTAELAGFLPGWQLVSLLRLAGFLVGWLYSAMAEKLQLAFRCKSFNN